MFLNISSAPGSWFLSGWYLRASLLKMMIVLVPDLGARLLPVSLLDLILGGPRTETQELVVVLLARHCYSNILWNIFQNNDPLLLWIYSHSHWSFPALTGWCRAPHWLLADVGVTPLCLCHHWPDHEHPELVPSVGALLSDVVTLLGDISLIVHHDVTRGAGG